MEKPRHDLMLDTFSQNRHSYIDRVSSNRKQTLACDKRWFDGRRRRRSTFT